MESISDVTTWQGARDILRKWREENERKSEEVVDLWINYVGANASKLGDEKWMILEQVAIAALDVHNLNIGEDAILELKERFPKSDRVMMLQIIRLQVLERYDEALKGLDAMILRDPTNSAAYKRRIAILKGQGRTSEAIKELTEYLNKFMSDQEGWSELCQLHLAEGDFNRAAFCAEELVLHNPHNYFVHQRIADIRYTMGGIENVKLALAYYSQAVKLNRNAMRAVLGLYLSSSSLASNQRVPAPEKKEYQKVVSFATDLICKKYKGSSMVEANVQVEMLEGVFGALQLQ